MTTHVKKAPVVRFRADTTLRWSVRDGDTLLWFRCHNTTHSASTIPLDGRWNLRDGNSILLSNRVVDLPDWFGLHPNEVCNAQCIAAMPRLKGVFP